MEDAMEMIQRREESREAIAEIQLIEKDRVRILDLIKSGNGSDAKALIEKHRHLGHVTMADKLDTLLLHCQDRDRKVIKACKQSVVCSPISTDNYSLGLAYLHEGKFELAIKAMETAVEENPLAKRFLKLGKVCLDSSRQRGRNKRDRGLLLDKAEKNTRRSITLRAEAGKSVHDSAIFALFSALRSQRRFEEAKEILWHAIALRGDKIPLDYQYHLALIEIDLDNIPRAFQLYQSIIDSPEIENDPTLHSLAHLGLGKLYDK